VDPIKVKKLGIVARKKKRQKLLFTIFLNSIFISCFVAISVVYGPLIYHEIRYSIATIYDDGVKNSGRLAKDLPVKSKSGEDILLKPILAIPAPADKNFSIIIPKINVNKNVVPNVNLTNESEVKAALAQGVGWSKGTVEPGQFGNSLIFAHSTRNAWDILRYNSEFTLLDKLQSDDIFAIVYQNRQYDFLVYEKVVVPANDTSYLSSAAEGRVVTLQTCYPPGSNSGRLLVRGRLVAMQVN
jgi:LPXTG-site transpeptidase (sortase) family protein